MEIVRNSQNLLDIAIQTTGDADNALDIALVNGLCLTDDLIAGQSLSVPDTLLRNENILSLLRATTADHPTSNSAAVFAPTGAAGLFFAATLAQLFAHLSFMHYLCTAIRSTMHPHPPNIQQQTKSRQRAENKQR